MKWADAILTRQNCMYMMPRGQTWRGRGAHWGHDSTSQPNPQHNDGILWKVWQEDADDVALFHPVVQQSCSEAAGHVIHHLPIV